MTFKCTARIIPPAHLASIWVWQALIVKYALLVNPLRFTWSKVNSYAIYRLLDRIVCSAMRGSGSFFLLS